MFKRASFVKDSISTSLLGSEVEIESRVLTPASPRFWWRFWWKWLIWLHYCIYVMEVLLAKCKAIITERGRFAAKFLWLKRLLFWCKSFAYVKVWYSFWHHWCIIFTIASLQRPSLPRHFPIGPTSPGAHNAAEGWDLYPWHAFGGCGEETGFDHHPGRLGSVGYGSWDLNGDKEGKSWRVW